jgi:hypothetical protein
VQAAASYGWQAGLGNFGEAARPVGWVERSETHHPSRHDNTAEAMGFTSFYPSYALMVLIDDYEGWLTLRSALLFLTLTVVRPGEVPHMKRNEIIWPSALTGYPF